MMMINIVVIVMMMMNLLYYGRILGLDLSFHRFQELSLVGGDLLASMYKSENRGAVLEIFPVAGTVCLVVVAAVRCE